MSSGTPRLSELARHLVKPAGIVSTAWPKVRDTCANLGWGFDTWQDGAGRLVLALNSDNLYAADTVVISIPRQVGKTYLVGAIVFALALIIPGLTVIWTAHRFKTARETFDSMKAMAATPKCMAYIEDISESHGQEGLFFRNGSRILFGARENGFGLGFANVGVLILDEAQRVTARAMNDLIPTMNTATNPLIFMMGTPPRPTDAGEVFTMMRQEALDALPGESDGTVYIEFSADQDAKLDDRAQLAKANPSFPHRTNERAIARMRKALDDDSFRREALGIWDEVSIHQTVISDSHWKTLMDVGPDDHIAPDALAVDMSHGMAISVDGCWMEGDSAHIEEVWAGTDVGAAIDWVAMAAGRRIEVLIDDLSPAAQMIPGLKARKVKVRRTTGRDMAKGCLLFETRGKATGRLLTHAGQTAVTESMKGARKRPISDAGGWGWDRRDSTKVIHPLVGCTLALLGATEKYKPQQDNGGRRRRGVVL